MPFVKGKPKTGGRKKGVKNKHNRHAELVKAAESSGVTPLEYMLAVMRDPKAPAHRRDDMAKAAAPYLHARLAQVEYNAPRANGQDYDSLPEHLRIAHAKFLLDSINPTNGNGTQH